MLKADVRRANPRRSMPASWIQLLQPTASTSSAPGNASRRSRMLTSSPKPPLDTSTSRSQRSGNWYANCIATPPPSDWPTNVARSCPERQEEIAHAARERAERVVAAGLLRGAVAERGRARSTVKCSASAGMTDRQVAELPAMPWIRTMTGPDPALRYPTRWPWISMWRSSTVRRGVPSDGDRIVPRSQSSRPSIRTAPVIR